MEPIRATEVRFIKLGNKGEWEQDCIEGSTPCIRLGFRSNQHRESLAGNWEAIYRYWHEKDGRTQGKATEFKNQVKAFYTLDESTIWVTFYKRKLYWCRTSSNVIEQSDKTRIRKVIGKWSSQNLLDHELYLENLSGALAKVQGFRGTICRINAADYLLRKINGESLPDVAEVEEKLKQLEQSLEKLIQELGWKDFELLNDLIFTHAGWQRLTSLGKTEKSIDLDLILPVTDRRAFVQVKSRANLQDFLNYKNKFESMNQYDEMYFVVHKPTPELVAYAEHQHPKIMVLTVGKLAKLVVSAGLTSWLIQKVS